MKSAVSLRALSPSPRPLVTSSTVTRTRALLQTTPSITKDLGKCLVFERNFKNHGCLTTPIPSRLPGSAGRNAHFNRNNTGVRKSCKNPLKSPKASSRDAGTKPYEWIPEGLKINSPGFSRALQEFEFASPEAHSPNCYHPSPSARPLYNAESQKQFLGRGSFGNVSLCRYQSHCFALKIVNRTSNSRVGERNMLGIRHAHIVTVFRVTEVFDKTFVCMEFAGHYNLQYLLDNKTDLNFQSKLSFAQQVASGLNHCHRNQIIHGDIKPANIIISPSGECKLGDFGLSMRSDDKEAKNETRLTGTAAYAAPEVLQGKHISTAADIYSFGITLWQIYTSEAPFAGEHPHIIIYKVVRKNMRPSFGLDSNEIATEYVKLTQKCWSRKPEDRPFSTEVLSQLKKLLSNLILKKYKRRTLR